VPAEVPLMDNNENVGTMPPPTATRPNETTAQSSMTELVAGMLNDAGRLFGQHIDMLKAEFQEDLRRTKEATFVAGLGVALLTIGGITLVTALVQFLVWMIPELPNWAASAIVGGVFAVLGLIAVYAGKRMFESFNPLPDKTFHALQENLSWISKAPK
jgi:uncharacterized membrane protein YqjE